MTVTATYDDTNGVVTLDATGFDSLTETVMIERSIDGGVTWTTVRGAVAIDLDAGPVTGVADYEYTPCVENMYRVREFSETIAFVSAGVASTGSSGSRTPGLPAGLTVGDVVFIFASTRNDGVGSVDLPTDWLNVDQTSNMRVMARVYDGIWVMPTVTFTGGAANEDTIAQACAFRNVDVEALFDAGESNSSSQNIAYDAIPMTTLDDNLLALLVAWKQDDWTSVAPAASFTEIQEASSTAGNDAAQVWNYWIQTTATDVSANSLVVTGGAAAVSRSTVFAFQHSAEPLAEQTTSITPTTTKAWIKSVIRPFLNRSIEMECGLAMGAQPLELLANTGPVRRTTRNAVFPIINRTFPVAVTDLSLGREWRLGLRTWTAAEHHLIDMLFASGDVLLIQVPCSDCAETFESGYVTAFDPAYNRHRRYRNRVVWEANVTEVAPPGPDIAYREATWATVLAQFGSWAAVLAAVPSWTALLALLPNPSEVIVE